MDVGIGENKSSSIPGYFLGAVFLGGKELLKEGLHLQLMGAVALEVWAPSFCSQRQFLHKPLKPPSFYNTENTS